MSDDIKISQGVDVAPDLKDSSETTGDDVLFLLSKDFVAKLKGEDSGDITDTDSQTN